MSGHMKRFRYYCEDENKWVDEERKDVPTSCKNNAKHRIKNGSLYHPSPGYCEIIPISNITALSQACDLGEINSTNVVEKVILIAGRLKMLEECALLKGLLVEKNK